MKTSFRSSLLLTLLVSFVLCVQAQTFTLKQSHENGVYKRGEKIQVTLSSDQIGTDSISIKVLKNNNQPLLKKAILPTSNPTIVFEGSFKEPCSVMVEARQKDKKQLIGMIVSPNKLKPGTDCPKDFDAYWAAEKQALEALRMEVKAKDMEVAEEDYVCQDVEINCTGPKPARGYFAKPKNAKVRSLPIVLME